MLSNTQLSPHFSLAEATFSSTAMRNGIDNSSPSQEVISSAVRTAQKMETVRTILGGPIHVDSWIRCLELNRALGSKDDSQHIKGEAVDFLCLSFGPPKVIATYLLGYKDMIIWDQLILEHGWIHISWNNLPNAPQRGQVLSLLSTGKYAIGLTDKFGKRI